MYAGEVIGGGSGGDGGHVELFHKLPCRKRRLLEAFVNPKLVV